MKRPIIVIPGSSGEKEDRTPIYFVHKKYIEALVKAGAEPLFICGTAGPSYEYIEKNMDGLLIVGGDDIDPKKYEADKKEYTKNLDVERDNLDFKLIEIALKKKVPVLGICRGLQAINIHFGGTLYQDIESEFPNTQKEIEHDNHNIHSRDWVAHKITIKEDSRLREILGVEETGVNGLHHQAIKKLGTGLRAVAHAPDGIVEAIEHVDHPEIIGVQCHPEELREPSPWNKLFNSFINSAIKN